MKVLWNSKSLHRLEVARTSRKFCEHFGSTANLSILLPISRLLVHFYTILQQYSLFFLLSPIACRYDKGAWSECAPTGQMSRTDSLKSSSDATCQTTRVVNKNCNQGKSKDKQNKSPKAEKKEKGKFSTRLRGLDTWAGAFF